MERRINMKRNRLLLKGVISTLLVVLFLLLFSTGFSLWLSPTGRIARETGWTFLGFDKHHLIQIHTFFAFTMTALILNHLLLNYKTLFHEMKSLYSRRSASK
ncbi:DUF4405 domain-containing protein [Evansella tamaricis]|uniref:DUF4405 domain-containing protein n=1 Tax=Evansella tamaricis TaxID=2069301 RepID=A0ABS6JD10_9BACI|nr:DUF4405 domain-containing protein [Evansella tamaricis]MBU9711553.1 DUF4405 domain-containing protein [Evansella tamaricis]